MLTKFFDALSSAVMVIGLFIMILSMVIGAVIIYLIYILLIIFIIFIPFLFFINL
jgi:hypothetical protein